MTPSQIGERAEIAIAATLALSGRSVWLPLSPSGRCDLIFEDGDGRLQRVQCKAGALRKGVVWFKTCSQTRNVAKDYRGQIDFFGVYCHERGEVYLVPVDVVGPRVGSLRVELPRNGQANGIRWAKDFVVHGEVGR
jgi:hypothetical protein